MTSGKISQVKSMLDKKLKILSRLKQNLVSILWKKKITSQKLKITYLWLSFEYFWYIYIKKKKNLNQFAKSYQIVPKYNLISPHQ